MQSSTVVRGCVVLAFLAWIGSPSTESGVPSQGSGAPPTEAIQAAASGTYDGGGGTQDLLAQRHSLFRTLVPSGDEWINLGPAPGGLRRDDGGQVSAIAVHPSNPDIVYVAGAGGGLWRSQDGGRSWEALTEGLFVATIALDPVNPEIVYVGLGYIFDFFAWYHGGVLRSTDGGRTWTRLGGDVFGQYRIHRVAIDPRTAGGTRGTVLYVASSAGLFRSNDGGSTWILLETNPDKSRATFVEATDVVLDPVDPNWVYAATVSDFGFNVPRSYYVATSSNGGVTWSTSRLYDGPMGAGLRVSKIAAGAGDPVTVFVAFDRGQLSKSTDRGQTWASVAVPDSIAQGPGHTIVVGVDPSDASRVLFGRGAAAISINGGISWGALSTSQGVHIDTTSVAFGSQGRIYLGTDGGLARTEDNGVTWQKQNNGLSLGLFFDVSVVPGQPLMIIGGTQDNGTQGFTAALGWRHLRGGDSYFSAISSVDPAIVYVGDNSSSTSVDRCDRSQNRCEPVNLPDGRWFRRYPLAIDPSSARTLLFAGKRVYRSTDGGASWAAVSPVLSSRWPHVLDISRSSPIGVYVGFIRGSGAVWVSRDGGATGEFVGREFTSVESIAVDPNNPEVAYVAAPQYGAFSSIRFNNQGGPGLKDYRIWKTTDWGRTWRDVSGVLRGIPTFDLLIDTTDSPTVVYAGTGAGLFSSDRDAEWSRVGGGLPAIGVTALDLDPDTRTLVVATWGRGIWGISARYDRRLRSVPY